MGNELRIGAATLTAMHTPGSHGREHVVSLERRRVFSGDTLFVNGVGRPDLHAGADGARARAGALFHSLIRLRAPPQFLVLPAHTAAPVAFDGRAIQAGSVTSTNGCRNGWCRKDSFIERVTTRIPATPPNFSTIVGLNEAGEHPEATRPTSRRAPTVARFVTSDE